MILPGATLGMLGGGQLGRMFTVAARTMGYRVIVLDPDPDSPAGRMADEHLHSAYTDQWALEQMARECAAVTTEFENVPAASLRWLEAHCPVRPSAAAVEITQDRIREKTFAVDNGLDTAPFRPITAAEQIDPAVRDLGLPLVLKRASFGYDGKGQAVCDSAEAVHAAFAAMGELPCLLETKVDLKHELSVVLARSVDGKVVNFPVSENFHVNGILDRTQVPAPVAPELSQRVIEMARHAAEQLDYCGVMAVEFFVDQAGRVLLNEMAPRPHNSGHYTLDATVCSQFEQQVRMLCGLPAASTDLLSPVVMVNLLGDLWQPTDPDWGALLSHDRVRLHLYGKREARVGRKMGHFSCLGQDLDQANACADAVLSILRRT